MVSKRNKLAVAVLFLTALSLFAVTNAFGGTLVTSPTTFAAEIVAGSTTLSLADVVYTLGISRSSGQNFLIRYTLGSCSGSQGPIFTGSLKDSNLIELPGSPDTWSWIADGTGPGTSHANMADFEVYINTPLENAGVINITLTGAKIKWTTPNAQTACGSPPCLTISVQIFDLYGAQIDQPTRTGAVAYLTSAVGFECWGKCTTVDTVLHHDSTLHPGTVFVPGNHDDAKSAEHMIYLSSTTTGVEDSTGTADYSLNSTDSVVITVTGDFTDVATNGFGFDDGNDKVVHPFTVNQTTGTATVLLTGDQLKDLYHYPTPIIIFIPDLNSILFPRTFDISVTVTGGVSKIANTLCSDCSPWWTWSINGTLLTSIYATNYPDPSGNCTKFRFLNWSGNPVSVIVDPHIGVMLDQGTYKFVTTDPNLWNVDHVEFVIPAHAVKQVSLTCAPAAGTGELGPMIQILTGVVPIRSTITFIAETRYNNVDGLELISSPSNPVPSGVIITEEMLKVGAEPCKEGRKSD